MKKRRKPPEEIKNLTDQIGVESDEKTKPLVLDLFCGAGGVSVGIHRAGFNVVGVDIADQPNYPFVRYKGDAIQFLQSFIRGNSPIISDDVAWIWASPPCHYYSWASAKHRNKGKKYPGLIGQTRALLQQTEKPYIIENVAGAPLKNKKMLCGLMFNLGVNRHRYFESNVDLKTPKHVDCRGRIVRGEAYTVAGHGGNSKSFKLNDWRGAMGIDWMNKRPVEYGNRGKGIVGNREDLCESIPPEYSEYLARQMI